jgi:Cysteine-rich secretory protein family
MQGIIQKAIFLFLLCAAVVAQAQKSPQEKQLFAQLNQSRQEAGLPPLVWDERLADAARIHTQRMVQANDLGHVLKGEPQVAERLAATGIHFNRSGENVGYDSQFDDLERIWMDSPPHRENILSPDYNMVGIGAARTDDGIWYATQDFAHGVPHRTASEAENLVAQSFEDLRKKEDRPPLDRVSDAHVHDLACTMAHSGKLDPRAALTLGGVVATVVYNNPFPEELPNSAVSAARNKRFTKFVVGACFAEDAPGNPGGTFYVVMTFY